MIYDTQMIILEGTKANKLTSNSNFDKFNMDIEIFDKLNDFGQVRSNSSFLTLKLQKS
jgi:hypothetical protein